MKNPAYHFKRIGLEAGPLSQWLYSALAEAGLPVICVETHRPAVAKPVSGPRSRKPATVSASALALHLDCSRTYIAMLEAEGVIQRQGDALRRPVCSGRFGQGRSARPERTARAGSDRMPPVMVPKPQIAICEDDEDESVSGIGRLW